MDLQIDKEGRILVAGEDGCIGGCVTAPPNSFTAKGFITRQSGGKRMLAQFDPVEPAIAGAPGVTAAMDGPKTKVQLSWQAPDDGGSAITAYKIYRRTGSTGAFDLLATVPETNFADTTFDKNATIAYHVTAVNGFGEGPFCHDLVPIVGVIVNPCSLPGVLAANDVNADGSDNDSGQNVPPDPSVNIRQIFVAEPDLGVGVNKLVFTEQVGANGSVLPNSEWYIIWNRLQPDADFDRFYVAMRSDANGAISFEYGKFGVPLDTSGGVPNPNSNTPSKLGDADKGTFDPVTGVIQITLSTSKAENIQPGQSLNGLNGRNFVGRPDQNPRGARNQAIAQDITGDGTYTVVGNAACFLNKPPLASLTASPTAGPAPLTVDFNASASSDSDPGDSVASYTFSFGDGSPDVTQATPAISHTYKHGGTFFATLTVKDSKGLQSLNIASAEIQVAGQLLNLSSRLRVQTDDNVMIGGFIIVGSEPKKVILRGIGPSLPKMQRLPRTVGRSGPRASQPRRGYGH